MRTNKLAAIGVAAIVAFVPLVVTAAVASADFPCGPSSPGDARDYSQACTDCVRAGRGWGPGCYGPDSVSSPAQPAYIPPAPPPQLPVPVLPAKPPAVQGGPNSYDVLTGQSPCYDINAPTCNKDTTAPTPPIYINPNATF